MPFLNLQVEEQTLALRQPFRISRGARTQNPVVVVRLETGGISGWGEATPYARYGETPASVVEQIESVRSKLDRLLTNDKLSALLPAGAARNALDCALWDLRAKLKGRSVWEMLALPAPRPVVTAVTVGIDTPEEMAAKATRHAGCPLLKVKLDRDHIEERIRAVREVAPYARLLVDPNESWTTDIVSELDGFLCAMGVVLLEQPIPAHQSDQLFGLNTMVPVCADEACHTSTDLPGLVGKYQAVNIKLDKSGGLTEAVNLYRQANKLGFDLMVGCMIGSSLAMAPAMPLAGSAAFVDLDGPAWISRDRDFHFTINDGVITGPSGPLWGDTRRNVEAHCS